MHSFNYIVKIKKTTYPSILELGFIKKQHTMPVNLDTLNQNMEHNSNEG